jgi:hypothetical protein
MASVTLLFATTPLAPLSAQTPAPPTTRQIDLGAELAAKRLRGVGRTATALPDRPGGIAVSAAEGPGLVWIEGSNFGLGTIEIDVRGKDVLNGSYLGVAFYRSDDNTYEDVYVRPFNFRATDPMRHQHAVQYESMPRYPWMALRQQFPEEFENPVDASVDPNTWNAVRLVVGRDRVRAFVGGASAPALDVRRLSPINQGNVGLWVGNISGGEFANLRLSSE